MYKVGVGQNDLGLDKTISFTQKACISYAIKQSTKDNEVRIMSAVPIKAYSNAKARENYKECLLGIVVSWLSYGCRRVNLLIFNTDSQVVVQLSTLSFEGPVSNFMYSLS